MNFAKNLSMTLRRERSLNVLAEFCPFFVCAAPSSLLSLAPGSPENL